MDAMLKYIRPLTDRLGVSFSKATWQGLASTTVWQIANYIVPLLTLPYLARVLKVEGFGQVELAAAATNYAIFITDWGCSLTGTQAISQLRDDPRAINRVVWAIITAKAMLALLTVTSLIAGALLFVPNPAIRVILYVSAINVFGAVLSVDWALRGVEKFSSFAASSIIGKMFGVVLVFILVQHEGQAPQAVLAGALGGVLGAAITLYIAFRSGLLLWPIVSIKAALAQLREGSHVFLSLSATTLYTNSIALVLGTFSSAAAVGLYSGANKIRSAAQNVLSPISMVAYSKLSYLATNDREKGRALSIRLLKIQGSIGFLISLTLFVTAPWLIHLFLGAGYERAVLVLRILAPLVFVIGMGSALGVMTMLPFGLKREFTWCVSSGTTIGLILSVPLAILAGAPGVAVSVVCAETLVTASMIVVLHRKLDWFRSSSKAR